MKNQWRDSGEDLQKNRADHAMPAIGKREETFGRLHSRVSSVKQKLGHYLENAKHMGRSPIRQTPLQNGEKRTNASASVCTELLEAYNDVREKLLTQWCYEYLTTRVLIPGIAPLCSKSNRAAEQERGSLCKAVLENAEKCCQDGTFSQEILARQKKDVAYRCREILPTDETAQNEDAMRQALSFAQSMLRDAMLFRRMANALTEALREETDGQTFCRILEGETDENGRALFSLRFREDVERTDKRYYRDYVGGYEDCPYPAIYLRDTLLTKGGTK